MDMSKDYITQEDGVTKVRTCVWSPPGDHPVGCSMFLTVEDGKVVKVEGDPEHPITQGRLCPRCLAMDEVLYHKDRITHPMKRAYEDRGKDKWEEITWDEAYDIIEAKVREIWAENGPQSIFTLTGTGRESTLYAPVYGPGMLNTPNGQSTAVLSGEACYSPRSTVVNYILGSGYPELDYAAFFPDRYDDPRFEVPKYIMVWGKDPLHSNPDGMFGHALTDLMKRGSKLIVIDPRLTWLASRAEYHLQIRPGTDPALGLAMINIIISEDLYDHDFVEKWCYGFEDLKERAAEYSPERVAEICWIEPEVIYAATRAFAKNSPSSALWGLAIDQMRNGLQAGQAFLDICALCGYIDIPGGLTITRPVSFIGKWRYEMGNTISDELKALRIVDEDGKYQMFNSGGAMPAVQSDTLLNYLEREDKPYPLRMSWWIGTNPLSCMAAVPDRWLKALSQVEFNVVNDIFMNGSIMALADIVLPLATSPEHNGVVTPHFGRNTNFVGAMNLAVDPGDTKSDIQILIEMGKRLRPELWEQYEDVEDFFDKQLRTVYDWGFEDLKNNVVAMNDYEYRKYETGKLRNDGTPGFETPTGLIELKSTIYKMFGEDPLPYYKEPEYSPYSTEIPDEMKTEYPLVYTSGGRNISMFHTEHRQIPSLRTMNPWPRVTINPETAEAHGIRHGDWVAIESPLGRCVQQANVSWEIKPWCIHMEHGWWFPEQEGEAPHLFGLFTSQANNHTPHESVGMTGYGAPYKNGICKIYKVDSLEG